MSEEHLNRFAGLDRSVLAEIRSVFERLVYIATLRNPETFDASLRQFRLLCCTISEVDDAIRKAHLVVFADWLDLNLEQKLADLKEYASRQDRSVGDVTHQWFESPSLGRLIPRNAQAPEVMLFRGDLELLQAVIVTKNTSPRS